ncbi:winged helix-turn-helix domain-containing protein [Ornithinimicrobium sp. Y1847]|uniref:winged helix-turn-helix domain-containing protein n=1 Tax=Ornithinimicrobium sp. Y1847 TaxID=3405419 RepID=UPI003B671263
MKVLVIDFGDRGAERLARALAADTHVIETASDVTTAVWACQEAPPDSPAGVAVAVACTPVAGEVERELGRRLRDAELATPLLVLAGSAQTEDVVDALDSGADDFVTRPVGLAEVCARVRALARRELSLPSPVISSGGVELDPAGHRVSRDGEEIDLSRQLFALLEAFVRNPGRLLTREVILDAVWDPASEPSSNVVEQAVSALRRRVDAPFGRASVQTVRGRGYRWDPAA